MRYVDFQDGLEAAEREIVANLDPGVQAEREFERSLKGKRLADRPLVDREAVRLASFARHLERIFNVGHGTGGPSRWDAKKHGVKFNAAQRAEDDRRIARMCRMVRDGRELGTLK